VVALDLCWPLLRYARRRSPALRLVRADLRRLPLAPEIFDGVWAAASLIHLPKSQVPAALRALRGVVRPGGLLGATFAHGGRSGYVRSGWIPGRFIARWRKAELARAVSRAGWHILCLETVTNRERKGRWVNLLARRPCP
jgi:ubiquinone/menaquinone biosynthesis C-methylase UbiE